jgi:hypothetical protein
MICSMLSGDSAQAPTTARSFSFSSAPARASRSSRFWASRKIVDRSGIFMATVLIGRLSESSGSQASCNRLTLFLGEYKEEANDVCDASREGLWRTNRVADNPRNSLTGEFRVRKMKRPENQNLSA